MNKQTSIELTKARKALVKLIWSDMDTEDSNDNETMAKLINEKLGYNAIILVAPPDMQILDPGFIVISNESDDQGWTYVEDREEMQSFVENFDEWDLHNGEGVVIVYIKPQ